jgi:hypothetical protein
MSDVMQELDRLLGQLEGAAERKAAVRAPLAGDVIDDVLASPARQTAVRSLRDAPEVEAFRNELIDGLIRADTANQLLRLVAMVVERLL